MRKSRSKIAFSWRTFAMLALVALSVQGCLGLGGGSGSPKGNFKNLDGSSNLQVNGDTSFDGSIYFTNNHNLFMIDGKGHSKQLSSGVTVQDPALSPNGKLLAFVIRYKNYSDLMMMSTASGWNSRKTILSGNGKFVDLSNNSLYWFAQPSWAPDNEHLLFASDLQKEYYWNRNPNYAGDFPNAPFLDLQIFEISIKNIPTIASEATMQNEPGAYTNPAYAQNYAVAYATYGDGGDLNPQFRPGSSKEFIFTHYQYDASTGTKQQIQIAMGNTDAISKSDVATYNPDPKGDMQTGNQPAVALSTPKTANLMPSFSPDGSAIVFIQRDPNGVDSHLNIMSSPPSGVTNGNFHDATMKSTAIAPYNKTSVSLLTQQFISQPVWSPNGKQIAYLSYANEAFDIWIVNVKLNPKSGKYEKVGDPMQVTNGGVDGDNRLVWSR